MYFPLWCTELQKLAWSKITASFMVTANQISRAWSGSCALRSWWIWSHSRFSGLWDCIVWCGRILMFQSAMQTVWCLYHITSLAQIWLFCFRDHNIVGFDHKYITVMPLYVSTFCHGSTTFQESNILLWVTSCWKKHLCNCNFSCFAGKFIASDLKQYFCYQRM